MSAHNYLPNSENTPVLAARAKPGGVNVRLAQAITQMKHGAFANAEVNEHFFRRYENTWSDNYNFRDANGRTFTTNIFGEILGSAYGSFLGAQGNHYPGNDATNPNLLTDTSKAKNVFALGEPTGADEELRNHYYNQICTAIGMRNADIDDELKNNKSYSPKEFIKPLKEGNDEECIILTGPLMYTNHPDQEGGSTDSSTQTQKRIVKKRNAGEAFRELEPESDTASDSTGTSTTSPTMPVDGNVYLGAQYDPRLLADYGGPLFNQRRARIIQQDFRNTSGNFIPPWKYWDELRPGTLILANVSLMVYVLPAKGMTKSRKIYHANINSLRVLDHSDVSVYPPTIDAAQNYRDSTVTCGDAGSLAFNSLFSGPANAVLSTEKHTTSGSVNSSAPTEDQTTTSAPTEFSSAFETANGDVTMNEEAPEDQGKKGDLSVKKVEGSVKKNRADASSSTKKKQ